MQGRDQFSGDCDGGSAIRYGRNRGPSCKDETRFQGIATGNEAFPPSSRWVTGLARTRPVFRGLRRVYLPGEVLVDEVCRGLQGRDPFSGDCDHAANVQSFVQNTLFACRDETRFQGIATLHTLDEIVDLAVKPILAGTRPVFRGLRRIRGRAASMSSSTRTCRDETRFQGIATGF